MNSGAMRSSSIVLFLYFIFVVPANAATLYARVASSAAGNGGLAVRVDVPDTPRYADGAPAVVFVTGGTDGAMLSEKGLSLDEYGFVELSFNFPGSGQGDWQSGGDFDYRGADSVQALADVVRFAQGLIPDMDGKSLAQLIGPDIPLTGAVGMVGASNGGNAVMAAAGKHGKELKPLAFLLHWESPVGDAMPTLEAGSHAQGPNTNPLRNPAYSSTTGKFDYTVLRYAADLAVTTPSDPCGLLLGGFYFDVNQNDLFDSGVDYAPLPFVWDRESGCEAYLSVQLTTAAEDFSVFPEDPPDHLATSSQALDFWLVRNGEYWFSEIVEHHPDVMFIVVAGQQDHAQTALDHPHILVQYNGFLDAGVKMARLNPDKSYVEKIAEQSIPEAVDNDAMAAFDRVSIRLAVEPSGVPELDLGTTVGAAACELADRARTGNTSAQFSPGAMGGQLPGSALLLLLYE